MINKSKKALFAVLLGCSVVLLATGCSKLKKEPETEAVTEAPQTETQPQTESETEPETEPITEAVTESESEMQSETELVLTAAEEKAQETEFDQLRTMYSKDDINVRTEPGTEDTSEIFSSFMQGDEMVVVGETPNWYVVDVDDYEDHGYVSKKFASETPVEPKSDEERQKLIEQELNGQTAGDEDAQTAQESVSPAADTSAVDSEYGVGAFAESFPVLASTGANVRSTPSQDGEIISTIGSGTTVTALGETDRWYKIEVDGTVGYVNKNLFTAE